MWGVETWGQYSISGAVAEIGVMASAAWASSFYWHIRPRRTNRWQFPCPLSALAFTPGRRLLDLRPHWRVLRRVLLVQLSALDHIGCWLPVQGLSALDHIGCGASGVVGAVAGVGVGAVAVGAGIVRTRPHRVRCVGCCCWVLLLGEFAYRVACSGSRVDL